MGATGAAQRWKVRGWIGSTGVRVLNVALCHRQLDAPDRTSDWVKVPSHIGAEGNTEADLLANAERLTNPLYPSQQHGTQRCEQRGEAPPKRKVECEPSSYQTGVLSACDAATLLQSLGLEVMSECSRTWFE